MARTLRETFGVGLSDLGGAVKWGEAHVLIESAATDPSTVLGAELAGWAYRATMPELLALVAQGGKPAMKIMPWVMQGAPSATPDEVAAAQAELEESIVFA